MEPVIETKCTFEVALVYPPSSRTGPKPTVVPITGHGIEVRVHATEGWPVVVQSLGYAVDARLAAVTGEVWVNPHSAVRILEPQIRVWLDEPAQMTPGPRPLSLPMTIPDGHTELFTLTAHTKEHDVRWWLRVEWTCGGEEGNSVFRLRTTAETGFTTFHPDGRVTERGKWFHPEPDWPEVAAEAERRYRHAAEAGDVDAMFQLGALLHERGELTEAEHWFQSSADAGHARAMASVGWILERRGNLTEAAQWYRKAADVGDDFAMRQIERVVKWPAVNEAAVSRKRRRSSGCRGWLTRWFTRGRSR